MPAAAPIQAAPVPTDIPGLVPGTATIAVDPNTFKPLPVIHPGRPEKLATVKLFDRDGNVVVVNRRDRGEFLARREQLPTDPEDGSANTGPAFLFEVNPKAAAAGSKPKA